MLAVLEAARLLVDRTPGEWHLNAGEPWAQRVDARSPRLGATIGAWVSRAATAIRQAHRRRQVIAELSAKDDRLLADIGITRAQIPEVAKAALGEGPRHASRPIERRPKVRIDEAAVEQIANDNETRTAA